MSNKHIGSNFDDFLKEECIEFEEQEFKKGINIPSRQIIIDGLDVSGCKYWKGYCRIASLCDYPGHLCEVTPNCNYKNWKRKEQECERLEKQNEILLGQLVINDGEDVTVQISQSQFEELNQLKAENEWVKSHFKQIDETNKILYQEKCELLSKLDGWDEIYHSLNEVAYEISLKYNKLKQTLTEIKEIAKKQYHTKLVDKDCINCDESFAQILEKISEVEDE